jgi:hypothetical protein
LVAFFYGIERDKPLYLVIFLSLLGLAVKERLFAILLVPIVVIYLLCLKVFPFGRPKGLNSRNLLILLAPGIAFGGLLGWSFIQDLPDYLSDFGTVNTNPVWILSSAVYYIGLPVVLVGAAGGLGLLIAKRDRVTLLLLITSILPLLVISTLALFQYAANRYIFLSLTSWIILAGVGMDQLFTNVRGTARVLAVGVFLILPLGAMGENLLYYSYQNGNRDNWKAAFQLIDARAEPDDLVVTTEPLMGLYYLNHPVSGIEATDLERIVDEGQRAWFVEDNNLASKFPKKMRWIETNARLIANFDVSLRARLFKMRVYLYDP